MKEVWKRFLNTEYKISNTGRVYSEKSKKLLSHADDGNGYMKVTLWIDGAQSSEKVHRLVACTFIDNPENLATVNHKNGVKTDNRVDNLEWLSHSDNMKHAHSIGLMQFGSGSYIAKLDEGAVEAIKFLFMEGLSNQEIANKYGVARGTISKIRQLKTWKHVRPDLIFDDCSITKHNGNVLSAEDIPAIRHMHSIGVSMSEIARELKVHSGTISAIISGKSWKNY